MCSSPEQVCGSGQLQVGHSLGWHFVRLMRVFYGFCILRDNTRWLSRVIVKFRVARMAFLFAFACFFPEV